VTDGEPAGDADARLAPMLAVSGLAFVPVTLVAVGVAPDGAARAWVFLFGLALTATLSLWAGVVGRRALTSGTSHAGRAMGASFVGFVVGVTATLMAILSLVGWLS
jgi:hypothetical protein